jgi:hypothetical protein
MNEMTYGNEGSKASDSPPTCLRHEVSSCDSCLEPRAGANAAHGLSWMSWAGVLIPPVSASYACRACLPQYALPPVNFEHLFRYPVQGNEGDHTQRKLIAPPHRDRGTRVITKSRPTGHDFYVKLQPATHFTFCSIRRSRAMDLPWRTQVNAAFIGILQRYSRDCAA